MLRIVTYGFLLQVLSLRGNLLEEVPDRTFQHLSKLELLDLSHNRINSVGDFAFENLTQLRVLHLSHNMLTQIPANSLKLVPHLADLSLGTNSFSELRAEDLQSLVSLTMLDLSGTRLKDGLHPSSFTALTGLRQLRLDDCDLAEVPTDALRSMERLEELYLNRNMFTEIGSNVLSGNRRLQLLEIVGCPNLERISSDAFQSTIDLRKITIARNSKLWIIPPGTFSTLTQVTRLDLHANNLQYLQRGVAIWNDIPVWLIEDNPLDCNCSVAWLRDELRVNNSSRPAVLCAAPPHLEGRSLVNVELIELSCGLGSTTQGIVIGVVVFIVVILMIGLILLVIYRSSRGSCLRHLMKGSKWGNGRETTGNLHAYPHDYPEYIMAPNKPVPVTEL